MAARLVVPLVSSGALPAAGSSLKPKQHAALTTASSDSASVSSSGHRASFSGRMAATPFLRLDIPGRKCSREGLSLGLGRNLESAACKFGSEGSGFWRKSSVRGGVEAEAVAGSDIAPADSSSASVEPGIRTDPARPAVDIVYEFYDGINKRDYERVAELFADECAYEDFNFAQPAKGKEEVMKFFKRIVPALGTEFMFVIDDITRGDPDAVGVLWHLDWRGKTIPNGRGCSFYRCEMNSSGVRQIKYARDIVEPATKPGFIAMGALRLIAGLLKRFPQLGNGF